LFFFEMRTMQHMPPRAEGNMPAGHLLIFVNAASNGDDGPDEVA